MNKHEAAIESISVYKTISKGCYRLLLCFNFIRYKQGISKAPTIILQEKQPSLAERTFLSLDFPRKKLLIDLGPS